MERICVLAGIRKGAHWGIEADLLSAKVLGAYKGQCIRGPALMVPPGAERAVEAQRMLEISSSPSAKKSLIYWYLWSGFRP